MSSETSLLRVNNISKSFASYEAPIDRIIQRFGMGSAPKIHQILTDISFDLRRGEIIGLVGCNGAGKTTLLRILSGILPVSAGTLTVHGRLCPVLDLGFGMVDDLTGEENIYFVGALRGFTRDQLADKYDAISAFADVGSAISDPIQHYSTGMKMRLAYAISTHLDPQILIIDEALAVGDEGFQHKCFEHLRTLAKQGVGIVLVSHSSQAIQELCSQAILLDQGKILQQGNPAKIIESYHRLLFASAEKKSEVRHAIRSGNEPSPEEANSKKTTDLSKFDPNTISNPKPYPTGGAKIVNPQILNQQQEVVNQLCSRHLYTYQFDAVFEQGYNQVRFGMLIKSITGFEIGGAETSHMRTNVQAGETVRLSFDFECSLNPGTYFLNAGALASPDGEETFIARIIDAIQIKVLPNELHQTGMVDFKAVPRIETK